MDGFNHHFNGFQNTEIPVKIESAHEENTGGVHAQQQQRTTRRKKSKKDKLKEKLKKKLQELRKIEEEKKKLAQELKKIEEQEKIEQDKKLAKAAREAFIKGLTEESLHQLKQKIQEILGGENETY